MRKYWRDFAIPNQKGHKTPRIQIRQNIHTNNTSAAIPRRIPRLDKKGIKRIQQIYGSILWYMQACGITTTKALNSIGRKQSKATETTRMWSNWLLDYLATHPNAKMRYWQSDMRLLIHSDISFLVEWDAKSNYGWYFYLGWNQNDEEP